MKLTGHNADQLGSLLAAILAASPLTVSGRQHLADPLGG